MLPVMASPDVRKSTTPALLAAVVDDARELAIGHLHRMQRESSEELGNLKRAIARTATAVGVVIVGAVLAGHAVAAGLIALGLPGWAGYALTAAAAAAGGVILLRRWPEDTTDLDLVPEEAIASLRRDVARVKHDAAAAAAADPPA